MKSVLFCFTTYLNFKMFNKNISKKYFIFKIFKFLKFSKINNLGNFFKNVLRLVSAISGGLGPCIA